MQKAKRPNIVDQRLLDGNIGRPAKCSKIVFQYFFYGIEGCQAKRLNTVVRLLDGNVGRPAKCPSIVVQRLFHGIVGCPAKRPNNIVRHL